MRRPELEDGGGAPGRRNGVVLAWRAYTGEERKREEVEGQGTSPMATRSFGGQQWPAAGNSLGGGACARVEGCGVQADAEKEVQGLKLGFYREG
jgi:hypothetical protein